MGTRRPHQYRGGPAATAPAGRPDHTGERCHATGPAAPMPTGTRPPRTAPDRFRSALPSAAPTLPAAAATPDPRWRAAPHPLAVSCHSTRPAQPPSHSDRADQHPPPGQGGGDHVPGGQHQPLTDPVPRPGPGSIGSFGVQFADPVPVNPHRASPRRYRCLRYRQNITQMGCAAGWLRRRPGLSRSVLGVGDLRVLAGLRVDRVQRHFDPLRR